MKRLRALLATLVFVYATNAQTIKPYAFGDTVSNLELRNIIRYMRPNANTADYRGRVIILDFWATWCAPSVEGLTKLDTLQKKFGSKLLILPVTAEDEETITTFFARSSLKQLRLPSIARDSTLSKRFPHATIPHTVIIDRQGKIVALTTVDKIDSTIIAKVWNREKLSLDVKTPRPQYNRYRSLLQNTETLAEFPPLFSSTLIGNVYGLPSTASDLKDDQGNIIGFTHFNTTAVQMYLSGFSQPEHYQSSRLVLENLPDPDFFFRDRSRGLPYFRQWEETHAYCYDIVAPLLTPAKRKEQMVKDLNKAFGVEAFMAEREIDCYLLQRTKPAGDTLDQIYGNLYIDPDHRFIRFYHARPAQIASYLDANIYINRPVFDDVGDTVAVNGDINYAGVLHVRDTREISLLVKDLNKVGLTLTPARRITTVLVIRRKL